MSVTEKEIDRMLGLLRAKILEKGYTQREIQSILGWGPSYISQLMNQQKSLRFEQMLRILQVIGVEPLQFFAELYKLDEAVQQAPASAGPDPALVARLQQDLVEQRQLLRALTQLLADKQLLT
jgi:transcriptional regulator with XRE-family HTH domain